MEVKLNTNIESVGPRPVGQSKPHPAPVVTDSALFDHTADLNKSFETAPAVRPEVVERAQELIANVNYPPRETIQKIAALLALHWNEAPDESGTPQR